MKKYRLLIALIVLVIWLAIYRIVGHMKLDGVASMTDVLSAGIYLPVVVAILFLFATVSIFKWDDVGLNAPFEARSLIALWLPLVFVILIVTAVFIIGTPPRTAMVFILVNTFLIGLSEELMFRGVLFQGLRSKLSIWPSIILTSLLFGSIHLLNALWLGNIKIALLQALAAACMGMLLMAIRIRTKSLDPAILFHAAWDFGLVSFMAAAVKHAAAIKPEVTSIAMGAIGVFVFVVLSYSIFLLRKVGRPEQT